jgi:ElaB/YqjD/DUF883 family membrane-anchored ribosome-binding protein
MEMRFATLQENEDVSKLARRLFRPKTKEAQQEAEKLLLKVNPFLADPKQGKAGAILVLPDIPGVEPTGEARSGPEFAAALLRQARDRVGDLGEALASGLQHREDQAKTTLEQVKSPAVRKLAKNNVEIEKRLDAIADDAKARIDRSKEIRKLQKIGLQELEKDLDEMIQRIGGSPGVTEPEFQKRKKKG